MTKPTLRPDRLLRDELERKEPKRQAWPAMTGDVNGVVEIPGRPYFIYVRIGSDEIPAVAYNNEVPSRYNVPVIVGELPWLPGVFQVLSERPVWAGTGADGGWVLPRVPYHHQMHEWGNPLGGDDAVFSHLRQLNEGMFRVGKDDGGNFIVKIAGGNFKVGSNYGAIAEQTIDLSAYQPAGVQGRYVLVYLNGSGVGLATAGTPVATVAALALGDCPVAGADDWALAAVRLYGWQAAIDDYADVDDLRWAQLFDSASAALTGLALVAGEFDFALTRHVVEG